LRSPAVLLHPDRLRAVVEVVAAETVQPVTSLVAKIFQKKVPFF
jgi:hypothetical protein